MFSYIKKKLGWGNGDADKATTPAAEAPPIVDKPVVPPTGMPAGAPTSQPGNASTSAPIHVATITPASTSFFKPGPHTSATPASTPPAARDTPVTPMPPRVFAPAAAPAATTPTPVLAPVQAAPPPPAPILERRSWLDKLRTGLRKTGSGITQVFTGTRIDDALYEELEAALLMADAGVAATEYLLQDLKRRVKEEKATVPSEVKSLLIDAVTDLLLPLEKGLVVGLHTPTVIMVTGVNGAGKTTTIGKLTRHLADANQRVLLAAADTFRAAAREQLLVWADRNQVDIVSQEGGDPAAVTFDAVQAGRSRNCDVVIADTAGRLATQLHLMEELRKIKRVIAKAMESAPHEVLLVVDGNTGQNALSQVKAFDETLGLTGLIVTKLDGTAKGGVLAAIALWSRQRHSPVPVYFVGVGEKLEDLQTFSAREFAQALLS
jgi:fused signal recognition particle receptor